MPIKAIERSGTTVEVVVGETLTGDDVALVGDALARGPRGATVTVDLRRVRTVDLPALLALSRVLERSGARFTLVGLAMDSRLLLRYLGAELESSHTRGAG